jgi:uncharacterized protein (TIGR03067 family)
MTLPLLMILSVGCSLVSDDSQAVSQKDLAALQGTWSVVSAHVDGKADAGMAGARVAVTGNTFERKNSSATVHGSFVLDPTRHPKSITTTHTDGPGKGKTYQGIYVLHGDAWSICYDLTGKPPAAGTPEPKAGLLLLVLKRVAPPPVTPPPSPFTDKSLENAVRAALHHTKPALTDADLNNLYVLEAPGANIRSLAGLEKCPNLALLKLTHNAITDISQLQALENLQSLDLAQNQVSDLRPLTKLSKLQYIELSHNQITKLEGLGGLTNLSALYLTSNKIADLGPLAKLTRLSSLALGNNQVRDLTVIAGITRLSTLELKDNLIEDLGPLAHQTELSILMLERNKIRDLSGLLKAAKTDAEGLRRFAPYLRLYLAGNPLSEQAKTKQLADLKSFGVRIEG